MINTRELCRGFGSVSVSGEKANLLGDVNFAARNVVFIFSE